MMHHKPLQKDGFGLIAAKKHAVMRNPEIQLDKNSSAVKNTALLPGWAGLAKPWSSCSLSLPGWGDWGKDLFSSLQV